MQLLLLLLLLLGSCLHATSWTAPCNHVSRCCAPRAMTRPIRQNACMQVHICRCAAQLRVSLQHMHGALSAQPKAQSPQVALMRWPAYHTTGMTRCGCCCALGLRAHIPRAH